MGGDLVSEAAVLDRLLAYHASGVLTDRELEALRLRFVSGFSWSQIAGGLEISGSSARGRVRSGLRKIRLVERVAA